MVLVLVSGCVCGVDVWVFWLGWWKVGRVGCVLLVGV